MNWRFTPDEFALVWASAGFDRYPYPLSIRTSSSTLDERDAQRHALRPWLEHTLDGDFQVAARLMTSPQTRVEVLGFDGADDSCPVRVLGASVGRTAVVLSQAVGTTPDVGGDVSIDLGPTSTLAARVVAALPKRKVGSQPGRTASLEDVQRDSKDVVMSSVATKSVAGQIRRMLRQPRNGIGHLLVSGRLDEADGRPEHVLSWVDVAADGRYLVRTRRDVELIPASDDIFAAELRRVLKEAQATG